MEHQQQKFNNPCLAYNVTKNTRQWGTITVEMKTEIIDGNEDVNNNYNATSGSWSDGPILNLIMLPCSSGWGLGNNAENNAYVDHYVYTFWTIYIYPIKTTLNMCHKLMYAIIGVLDLCFWNTKKNNWINNIIEYIFDMYNLISIISCH